MTAPALPLQLRPSVQATLSLSGEGGALALGSAHTPEIAAQLAPIYRGDPGPPGPTGTTEVLWNSTNW